MNALQPYLKALFAGVLAGLGALQVAYLDGAIDTADVINVAIAALGTLAVVWGVPNVSSSK